MQKMQQRNLTEAKTQLAELIEAAASGEEVIIARGDGSLFKIVPVPSPKPVPKFGSARGLITMSDDFDEPLEGFEDYTP
jgi:antitoxin (DNA-binding transcriptional repressor) of toxin-antitoxin stability system